MYKKLEEIFLRTKRNYKTYKRSHINSERNWRMTGTYNGNIGIGLRDVKT